MPTPTNVFVLSKRVRARLGSREPYSLAYPRAKEYSFQLFDTSSNGRRVAYSKWQEPLLDVYQAYNIQNGEPLGPELRVSCVPDTNLHIAINRLQFRQASKVATQTKLEALLALNKFAVDDPEYTGADIIHRRA